MEISGENNHRVAARVQLDRFAMMDRQGPLTVTNINSWNNYKHSCSGKQPFYENEYKKMVSHLEQSHTDSTEGRSTDDPFQELVQLSVLADNVSYDGHPNPQSKRKAEPDISSLFELKRCQDEKHQIFMTLIEKLEEKDQENYRRIMLTRKLHRRGKPTGEFFTETPTKETEGNIWMGITSEGDSSMESIPVGDFTRSSGPEEDFMNGSLQEEDVCTPVQCDREKSTSTRKVPKSTNSTRKVPKSTKKEELAVCRHFAKGWCRKGDACSFQHSVKDSYPDSIKVFLGGLPCFMTSSKLVEELGKLGYKVVNVPKIFRGFSPQVCLAPSAEAMEILKEGKITICGCEIDVRPYKAVTKKEQNRQLKINKRSVFLGGLPSSVTVQVLKASIEKLGMKMTNRPMIKSGFVPKVTLASDQQAQDLVARGVIVIYGSSINVRPYEFKNQHS